MTDYLTIYNRLKKNTKKIKNLLNDQQTNAYRVYDKDIPEYPYIIDIYGEYALVYEKGKRLQQEDEEQLIKYKTHQEHIFKTIVEVLKIDEDKVVLKSRQIQKGQSQYEKLAKKNITFEVFENEMKFLINPFDYLDSGLFLDHRPLRKKLLKTPAQSVLNLFAYTGSLSVACALAGAKVTTVDMSNTYLSWAKNNFEINQLSVTDHEFIQADVLGYIDEIEQKYDLILLDPPSFSNSKRMQHSFNVQDHHQQLIKKLMSYLNPSGELLFSNNFTKFKLDENIINNYIVKDISAETIPKDFRNPKVHVCFSIKNPCGETGVLDEI